jgi:hypothetical protein
MKRPLHLCAPLCAFVLAAAAEVWSGSSAAEWQVRANIPHHVYGHSGAVAGSKLYALGGCNTPDWQKPCAYNQVYDPAADSWTLGPELPLALGWAMAAVHAGKIYLFGGGYYDPKQGITSTAKAWRFDPDSNRWEAIRDLPAPIMNGFASTVDDFIYVGLGYNRQGGEGILAAPLNVRKSDILVVAFTVGLACPQRAALCIPPSTGLRRLQADRSVRVTHIGCAAERA